MFEPDDEYGAAEVELLQMISDVPVLSRGLRARVLVAAARSHRRRTIVRRAVACLFATVSVFTFCCMRGNVSHEGHSAESQSLFGPGCGYASLSTKAPLDVLEKNIDDPADLIALTEIGSWDHVDAEFRIREMHRHSLQQLISFQ